MADSCAPGSPEICHDTLVSGQSVQRIEDRELSRLMVTDTVPLQKSRSKIHVISVAPLFANASHCIFANESVSTLFVE